LQNEIIAYVIQKEYPAGKNGGSFFL